MDAVVVRKLDRANDERQWSESGQRCVEEPCEPNAFSLSAYTDKIQTIVPVSIADQR